MTKQVVNTRGMKIEDVKECLRARIQNRDLMFEVETRMQKLLDYHLYLKDQNEREINYLEKFIARKESKK